MTLHNAVLTRNDLGRKRLLPKANVPWNVWAPEQEEDKEEEEERDAKERERKGEDEENLPRTKEKCNRIPGTRASLLTQNRQTRLMQLSKFIFLVIPQCQRRLSPSVEISDFFYIFSGKGLAPLSPPLSGGALWPHTPNTHKAMDFFFFKT